MIKKGLLAFLICLGGCVAIVDDSNLGLRGAGGSGSGGVIGTGGATLVVGTGGIFGSGGNFGSEGTLGTGGSFGSGGAAMATDGGAGTGDRTAGPDAGAPDGGLTGAGGARADAGTGTGGVMGGGDTAAVCTSNVTWRSGNGPLMRPGNTCNSCHGWTVSGTIYPTAHEPTNCNGVNGSTGVRVVITGANGTTLTLTPSAAGNFYTNTSVSAPFTAKVTSSAGTTRAMVGTVTSGNCNSCHTQNGANGAPGRIMAP